ncbi:hypothetical protein RvY_17473 [Ramazzottius varieornatus]|uniref:Chitin-binding type-2 domain-containing protein n=1 Tax=Ramazzottius varieornatus TaxID=947166 RepID=A0A1D1W630_RAMVA|nr:hypothetical protein RvY_17473 [Ramazzottius varieornatus]
MAYVILISALALSLAFYSSSVEGALTCESNSPLCLEARGQFAVPNECRKFANCWDSCATFSSCPGTLVFSGDKNRCDFGWNLTPSDPCYKPMMASAGGAADNFGGFAPLPPLPPLNPLFQSQSQFAPTASMSQGINQDGTMFQNTG